MVGSAGAERAGGPRREWSGTLRVWGRERWTGAGRAGSKILDSARGGGWGAGAAGSTPGRRRIRDEEETIDRPGDKETAPQTDRPRRDPGGVPLP